MLQNFYAKLNLAHFFFLLFIDECLLEKYLNTHTHKKPSSNYACIHLWEQN